MADSEDRIGGLRVVVSVDLGSQPTAQQWFVVATPSGPAHMVYGPVRGDLYAWAESIRDGLK